MPIAAIRLVHGWLNQEHRACLRPIHASLNGDDAVDGNPAVAVPVARHQLAKPEACLGVACVDVADDGHMPSPSSASSPSPTQPVITRRFEVCADERFGGWRDDGVAVGAQAHHSGGSPINQRECAGFNWPPLAIPAQEPISISPEAVSRAGCGLSCNQAVIPCESVKPKPFPLPVETLQRSRRAIRASRSACPNSCALGVGQPASHATRPSSAFNGTSACMLAPSFQSRVVGVGHPVEPVSDMRSADARSRERDRPEGIT